MKKIKYLWNYSGKYRYAMFLLPLAILLDVSMEILIPYLMSAMLDQGINQQRLEIVFQKGMLMIGASVLLVFAGMLESYLIANWSSAVTQNLRNALFETVQGLPFSDTDRYGTATILTRMSTDMNFIKRALGMYHSMIRCPIMILCTIFMTMKVYSSVTWIFVAAAALFVVILFFVVKIALKHYRQMFVCYDELSDVLEENVTAARTVKAFAREDYENQKFGKKAKALKKETLAAESILVLNDPLLQLVMNLCILIIVYVGGRNIIAGNMQAGDLFCIISYTNQILLQIYIAALILIPILSAQISLDRVFEIIDTTPSFTEPEDSGKKIEDGSVELEHADFSYYQDEEKKVLKDINLCVKPGEFIGIIGSSGSGKTSLIHLIPRFYERMHGIVKVGGHRVEEYSFKELRDAIGLVPQQNLLFAGTIRENLCWGKEDASAEEIVKACSVAEANDFILSFPEGYDTKIDQSGQNLSGGQRQRLCIARALIKQPKILILDDSLSAVDNTTERRILQALTEKYKDTTILMVSQRISSIMKADQILVLDNGKVDAVGTHADLLEKSEIYKEIYESQRRSLEE